DEKEQRRSLVPALGIAGVDPDHRAEQRERAGEVAMLHIAHPLHHEEIHRVSARYHPHPPDLLLEQFRFLRAFRLRELAEQFIKSGIILTRMGRAPREQEAGQKENGENAAYHAINIARYRALVSTGRHKIVRLRRPPAHRAPAAAARRSPSREALPYGRREARGRRQSAQCNRHCQPPPHRGRFSGYWQLSAPSAVPQARAATGYTSRLSRSRYAPPECRRRGNLPSGAALSAHRQSSGHAATSRRNDRR